MSERFNRENQADHIKEDRLFPDDFIDDQDGQDADLLQLAADFGCVPCIGDGLVVTALDPPSDNKVQVSDGWAYDEDGQRISVGVPQEVTLTDTTGGDNYIVLYYDYVESEPRPAHRTGTVYPTRISDWFEIKVLSANPGEEDKGIVLAKCKKQTEPEAIIVEITERLAPSCRLVAQSMIEIKTTGPRKGPPPGQKPELPDYPLGRDIPMPIILFGTRSGSPFNGVETILLEELGRVPAAEAEFDLERVTLKSGTPMADVLVWIGDWGTGQQDGTNPKKCNFSSVKSGAEWDEDLWITGPDSTPPATGPGYYYLVRDDESWFSKIEHSGCTDGTNWVTCEEDLKDADSHTFYICPYAERYQEQALPFKTDTDLDFTRPKTVLQYNRIASPVAPVVRFEGLNLGGKYKLKVASVISSDNYTNWATKDFIVGSDLVVCWYPASSNLNVIPVDGGVEITIPAKDTGEDPEAYELCYTYGTEANPDPPAPEFTNSEHPTIRVKERKFKIDAPPGRKVRVKCRAIRTRMVMRCTTGNKVLEPTDTYILAGGVSLRRNRKAFTGMINEQDVSETEPDSIVLVDEIPLANPIWPEKIFLFNPTGVAQTDFEIYIHGGNEGYLSGRKFQIGEGGDESEVGARGSQEKSISDYRITDDTMMVTIKNIGSSPQTFDLRYGVQYREDSEAEQA